MITQQLNGDLMTLESYKEVESSENSLPLWKRLKLRWKRDFTSCLAYWCYQCLQWRGEQQSLLLDSSGCCSTALPAAHSPDLTWVKQVKKNVKWLNSSWGTLFQTWGLCSHVTNNFGPYTTLNRDKGEQKENIQWTSHLVILDINTTIKRRRAMDRRSVEPRQVWNALNTGNWRHCNHMLFAVLYRGWYSLKYLMLRRTGKCLSTTLHLISRNSQCFTRQCKVQKKEQY